MLYNVYIKHLICQSTCSYTPRLIIVAECSPVMTLGTSCSSEGTNLKFCQLYA